jgi:hypothetical protein
VTGGGPFSLEIQEVDLKKGDFLCKNKLKIAVVSVVFIWKTFQQRIFSQWLATYYTYLAGATV